MESSRCYEGTDKELIAESSGTPKIPEAKAFKLFLFFKRGLKALQTDRKSGVVQCLSKIGIPKQTLHNKITNKKATLFKPQKFS